MTKKHLILLAAALKAEKPGQNWNPNKHVQWAQCVRAVASVARFTNPMFSENKFLAAAGFTPCTCGEGYGAGQGHSGDCRRVNLTTEGY